MWDKSITGQCTANSMPIADYSADNGNSPALFATRAERQALIDKAIREHANTPGFSMDANAWASIAKALDQKRNSDCRPFASAEIPTVSRC